MANITVGYDADGNALDYTTIGGVGGAYAAANSEDNLQIWYSDANQNNIWYEQISNTSASTKLINLQGMLATRQVTICHSRWFLYLSSNFSAQVAQLTWQNITFTQSNNNGTYYYTLAYDDSSYNGEGVLIKNCCFYGCNIPIYIYRMKNDSTQIQNCIFVNCGWAIRCSQNAKTWRVYNCTFTGGYEHLDLVNDSYIVARNNVFFISGGYNTITGLTGTFDVEYCAFHDTTATTYSLSNCYEGLVYTDMGFLYTESNDKYPLDFRVASGSYLLGKGTDVSLTEDIDDVDYTGGPYPIGASNGISLSSGGGGGGGPVGMGVLG